MFPERPTAWYGTSENDIPSRKRRPPSHIDLDEWETLATGRADRRPLLAVVVGRQNLHVELMHADGIRQEFIKR